MLFRYVAPTLVGLFALILLAAPAQAQEELPDGFRRCGDPNLVLVFMNPDLMPREDGYVHASGSFFIQFQARGEAALQIETFKFSFGKYVDGFPETCDTPEWVTAAYLKNYRADYDPNDGFFIPINTCLVPDGEYAAAISAYDAQQTELVRYYTRAIVANGEGSNAQERCANPDTTAPWPMILPGDGERFDGGQGLYIEVGEDVAGIEAFINGKKLVLAPGEGPARDDDLIPDLGYTAELRETPLANSQLQTRKYPAFTWDGVIGGHDVVKVKVIDKWGNVAEKVVHIGDPTIGGRVTLVRPDFDLEVPEKDLEADANGTATYNVSYITKSEEGLHADLYVRARDGGPLPEGITYRLTPDHVMMGGNSKLDGTVRLIATPDVELGTYEVQFVAQYQFGAQREEKIVPLTFRVVERAQTDATQQDEVADKNREVEQQDLRGERLDRQQQADEGPAPEEKSGIPMPSPLLLVGAIGAVALLRRRLGA